MKLPIILSAMIAALAIPGSLASEATEEKKEVTEEKGEAPAPEAEKPTAKMMHKKRKAEPMMGDEKKPMHKKEHHGSGQHHTTDEFDKSFSDSNFPKDGQGKMMPPEVPGKEGPMVPAGQ